MNNPFDSRPTAKMKRVYHRLCDRWGEPSELYVFDARELDHPVTMQLIHVPAWGADDSCGVTSFVTLGMAEHRMAGAPYFCELSFAYRGPMDKQEQLQCARLLANLVEYPFQFNLRLDWWETIRSPGPIPFYPGCKHLLLAPSFGEDGFDEIDDPDGAIKLLYVIPITPFERHLLTEHGRDGFLDHVVDREIDLFSDRTDEAESAIVEPLKQPLN